MQSQLPEPDTHATFTHPLLDTLMPMIKVKEDVEGHIRLRVDAKVKGSDIKWNDFAGTLKAEVFDLKTNVLILPVFSVQLVHFTGNCGIKALSHLYVANQLDAFIKTALQIIESFAYYKTNCGMLIGSDTYCSRYKGNTIRLVEKGENYHIEKPTWNPNYTWSKDHTIALFWKDLNGSTHEDGWVQETKGI